MIGYCATASSGIEIAPTRQMNRATTQAKIGLHLDRGLAGVGARLEVGDDLDLAERVGGRFEVQDVGGAVELL
ncbi:hypothetical protein, partial [Hymenobacter lapidiphilus]|uniref:hypothetical protein n=1 Tax=Hymenobacter sp. CCM 8763 TaxID=2303334 RepID=UPI001A92355F